MYPGVHAATHPDKAAVIMGRTGERVTYQQLNDRSLRLAQLLHSAGLRRGDNVALCAENHPRYFEVLWAALRSGLYLTAVNRYLSAEEAAYLVNDSGSLAFITTKQLAATATEMLPLIPDFRQRFMMDGSEPGFEGYGQEIGAFPAR